MNKFINEPRSSRLLKAANISDSRGPNATVDSYQDRPDFSYPSSLRRLPKGWKNEEIEKTPKKASMRPGSGIFDFHKA